MATLGDLERAVMNLLWDASGPRSAATIREELASGPSARGKADSGEAPAKELALTTVLTVLSRLEGKGFVTRARHLRPHLYEAVMSRADHMADLMHQVLGTAPDREAVLARFVGSVSSADAAALRRILDTP